MPDQWKFAVAGMAGLILGGLGVLAAMLLLVVEEPAVAPPVAAEIGAGGAVSGAGPTAAAPDASGAPAPKADPAAPTSSSPEPPAKPGRVKELEDRNAKLQEEIAALKARLQDPSAPAARSPQVFRFGLSEKTPVFDQADWTKLSGHMRSLSSVIPKLASDIVEKGKISDPILKEVQAHNTPLAAFAVQAAQEIEGTGPNGSYTHPAVIANLIRAALIGAGAPLSEGQEIAIRALGNTWAAEEERRKKSYGESTPALAKTADEVDGKKRFLRAVKDTLTPPQLEILFQPSIEGRIGLDLLSPGLVYVMQRSVPEKSRADLEKKVLQMLFDMVELKPEDASGYEWIARQWMDEVPLCIAPLDGKSMDLIFPHVDHVQEAARAEAAAIERILGMRRLTPEQASTLLGVSMVLVPRVVAAAGGNAGGAEGK